MGVDVPLGEAETVRPVHRRRSFAALTLGAVGVVFGDIGTSPLYALREALAHARPIGTPQSAVLGVVSLILWTLVLIVTVKYIAILMRADNKGEGGPVALMTLAQRAYGKPAPALFALGVVGVALFYGDGVITPAFSVISAVEGLRGAPHMGHVLAPWVLPISAGILVGLFLAQARGTHRISTLFGPVMACWFLTLGALGVWNLRGDLTILGAVNPIFGARFLIENGFVGFVILGSVFLAVTGAEALYADMGHFGKRPIRAAWFFLVFPCLALNYLGQGALVLARSARLHNPFFAMAPHIAYWPVLGLATVAAVIASQAVISGAFSMTQQAVQLGLLPRIDIKRTSETQTGQILRAGGQRPDDARCAAAAGGVPELAPAGLGLRRRGDRHDVHQHPAGLCRGAISVEVAGVARRRRARARSPAWIWCSSASNLLKIVDGAWLPLAFGGALVLVMWTWSRGVRILTEKTRADSVPLDDLVASLTARPPHRAPGTAMFLTANRDLAPVALLHNLKHNKVLHLNNVIVTVETAETPRVREADRIRIEPVGGDFKRLILRYGFMESPNLPKTLAHCRKMGLKFDIMSTSFFLGRRTIVPDAVSGMPLWQDRIFIFLMKNAANPTDFFKIPPGRVVELGTQITV